MSPSIDFSPYKSSQGCGYESFWKKMGYSITREDIRARTAAERSAIVQGDNFNVLKSFSIKYLIQRPLPVKVFFM